MGVRIGATESLRAVRSASRIVGGKEWSVMWAWTAEVEHDQGTHSKSRIEHDAGA